MICPVCYINTPRHNLCATCADSFDKDSGSTTVDVITWAAKRSRAKALRDAANLFCDGHWAWSELHRMATKIDGIAVDGFPVGGA